MKPTPSDVHVNQPLTQISIAFIQAATNFIATRVFPNISVDKQSDLYYEYDRGDFNRDEMKLRAPATESSGGGFRLTTTPYFAPVYAFHKDVDDQARGNQDSVLNLDSDATQFVTMKGLIKREKLWVEKFFKTNVWSTDITGVSGTPSTGQVKQWNDEAADPIGDVDNGKAKVLESTGFEPNVLVIGYRVYQALRKHPDIIDRVKYTQNIGPNETVKVSASALANLFEVDEVLVMRSIENTAGEGLSNTHGFIGGKKALLAYRANSPGLLQPSAGYTFSWRGYLGASDEGHRIAKFRMEHLKADRVEIEMAFDQKKIGADLGFFWDSIVA